MCLSRRHLHRPAIAFASAELRPHSRRVETLWAFLHREDQKTRSENSNVPSKISRQQHTSPTYLSPFAVVSKHSERDPPFGCHQRALRHLLFSTIRPPATTAKRKNTTQPSHLMRPPSRRVHEKPPLASTSLDGSKGLGGASWTGRCLQLCCSRPETKRQTKSRTPTEKMTGAQAEDEKILKTLAVDAHQVARLVGGLHRRPQDVVERHLRPCLPSPLPSWERRDASDGHSRRPSPSSRFPLTASSSMSGLKDHQAARGPYLLTELWRSFETNE